MSLLQIFCLKLLKHRNQGYVQFYIDFPIRMENLIKVKRSGDCNVVHNDCTIAFEPWSSTLLKNRPNNENNPAGILISFYHGRRVQLYISGDTMYTRVNQGAEDYNSWLQWVKCSN